jgi:hypothetical protein
MRLILLAAAALGLISGCATGRSDGSPQIQTTAQANQENVAGVAAAPLRDANVAAHSTNTFATIVIERDGFFVFLN